MAGGRGRGGGGGCGVRMLEPILDHNNASEQCACLQTLGWRLIFTVLSLDALGRTDNW